MFPVLFRQEGQGSGIVVGKVLDIAVVEQKLGKGPRRLARLHASRCLADQGRASFVVTPRHNVLRLLPRRLTAELLSAGFCSATLGAQFLNPKIHLHWVVSTVFKVFVLVLLASIRGLN